MTKKRSLKHFKMLTLSGTPYERGHQYGEQARSVIDRSLESYYALAEHYQPQSDKRRLHEMALEFIPFIEKYDPEIMEEIRGIAEGADLSLGEIMFLNVRSELTYPQMRFTGSDKLAECSTLAVTPEASSSGHTLA